MKNILIFVILLIVLQSCEKDEDFLVTFTIKNTSNKMFNGKIEAITYLSQKPIFSETFKDFKNGNVLVFKIEPKILVNNEGIYYITVTDEVNKVTKKGFGGFDGYDFLGGKYIITITEDEILIK